MKFLSSRTDSKWKDISAKDDDPEKLKIEALATAGVFERFLLDVLLSENLIVLCGLGSSRSVKLADGKEAAPTMADLWEAAKAKAGEKFSEICTKAKYSNPEEGDNIEVLLSACQLAHTYQEDEDIKTFIAETEKIIVERCRFVKDDMDLSTHEAFIRKSARRSTRQPRLKLFTTNYDTCFEASASRIHFVVVDGFSHTNPQEFDGSYFGYDFVRREQDRETPDYIPNVFHLYKLHGSVDWEFQSGQIRKADAPPKPVIIYPRHTKYEHSYDQPFLEMMSRFQLGLRQPNTALLVIGFGFNDLHIAQPIVSAVKSNVGLRCLIVGSELEGTRNKHLLTIADLARTGDHRLGLLAGKFEEVVPRVPDLVAATEEELHKQRLLRLKEVR